MTNQHPITPPPELVEQRLNTSQVEGDFDQEFATFFAQWGADQELEACCEWLVDKLTFREDGIRFAGELRAARRPKPPSLKEQALADLDTIQTHDPYGHQIADLSTIRRAIADELEGQ
jgi:hypothetical protein